MATTVSIDQFIRFLSTDRGYGKVELSNIRYRQLAKDGRVPMPVNGVINVSDAMFALLVYYQRLARDKESPTLLSERARLTRTQADRAELKLKKESGELIPTASAMQQWGAVIQTVRQKILAIPMKTAPLLYGLETAEIKERLQRQIFEVLEELSNPRLYGSTEAANKKRGKRARKKQKS